MSQVNRNPKPWDGQGNPARGREMAAAHGRDASFEEAAQVEDDEILDMTLRHRVSPSEAAALATAGGLVSGSVPAGSVHASSPVSGVAAGAPVLSAPPNGALPSHP